MDTKLATPWFDVILPGEWSKSAPEPGLTIFRSPAGAEQLSISSLKRPTPPGEADDRGALAHMLRVRRQAELRNAPQMVLSDPEHRSSPARASFSGRDAAHNRRTATLIVAHAGGFVVFFLESIGSDASVFDAAAERLVTAGGAPPG